MSRGASHAWVRALTLEERIALLERTRRDSPSPRAAPRPTETARAHVELWREIEPLRSEEGFDGFLAFHGLTRDRLLDLLSMPERALASAVRAPPEWRRIVLASRRARRREQAGSTAGPQAALSGLLAPVAPIAREGARRLEAALDDLASRFRPAPFDKGLLLERFLSALADDLLFMVMKPLVLELHIAGRSGLLAGDGPEERFRSFLRRLKQPAFVTSILRLYPVLPRVCATRARLAAEAFAELVGRLCADRQAIERHLGGGRRADVLRDVQMGLGDPHGGGRTVAAVAFASGLEVVYKPRSMAVDCHFQEVLRWANRQSRRFSFRVLEIVDRGSHGWVERVVPAACGSLREVERFYFRQGANLALLHVLGAYDFHHENLLAAGEHPVLVDLETLFAGRPAAEPGDAAEQLAEAALQESVLAVGLLPMRLSIDPRLEAVDITGLGGGEGQTSPLLAQRWCDAFTDRMHLERERVPLPAASNLPVLDGEARPVLGFRGALMDGLRAMLDVLRRGRDDLAGLLGRFERDPVRTVVRATSRYAALLAESYHPHVLGDALDRDRLFDELWTETGEAPELRAFLAAEKRDLWNGDVPVFTTTPGSRTVRGSDGRAVYELFEVPGLELSRRRLRGLGDEEVDRQQWLVRASLDAAAGRGDTPAPPGPLRLGPAASAEAAALAIGEHLARRAFASDGRATWLGLLETGDDDFFPGTLGTDLHSGLPGVALFLVHLGRAAGRADLVELGRSAARTLAARVAGGDGARRGLGAFLGLGGVIHGLTHLGVLLGDGALLSLAGQLVEGAPESVAGEAELDVLGGVAGCVLSLVAHHESGGARAALEKAARYGDHLCAAALRAGGAATWAQAGSRAPVDGGVAHGAAGIAYSLARLHPLSGDARHRETAEAALRGIVAADPDAPPTWCRGAIGTGLVLGRVLGPPGRRGRTSPLETLVARALEAETPGSDCLCHGAMGVVDLLIEAARTGGDSRRAAVGEHVRRVVERAGTRGWMSGLPTGIETPGLMIGLAGIGYQLLRSAAPGRVPSILLLDPCPAPGRNESGPA